jgi:predicted aldo/keto reductase-like oxidoreductase
MILCARWLALSAGKKRRQNNFKTEAAREKSMRYAMSLKELNAVVIGFEHPQQVDDTIKMMNRVLAEV